MNLNLNSNGKNIQIFNLWPKIKTLSLWLLSCDGYWTLLCWEFECLVFSYSQYLDKYIYEYLYDLYSYFSNTLKSSNSFLFLFICIFISYWDIYTLVFKFLYLFYQIYLKSSHFLWFFMFIYSFFTFIFSFFTFILSSQSSVTWHGTLNYS